MAPINCDYCGAVFEPAAPHQRFCSDSCRVTAWQQQARGDRFFSGTDYALLTRMGFAWISSLLSNPKEHWERELRGETPAGLTWKQLARHEPRLLHLWHLAKATYDDHHSESFCANMVWYKNFKPILCALVGWSADDPPHCCLLTTTAYDIAYEKVYDALPSCRNCGCF